MSYHCECCDKTNKLKSKNKQSESPNYEKYERFSRINHTIKNPNFFDVDEIFNYFTYHNKKF